MRLSIITINYNNRDGLVRTIESVRNQTFDDYEWIVIDGGSTDGSKELIEQNAEHITYWESESDRGIYHAMNKGIAKATCDYLLFLNSGDCFADTEIIKEFTSTEHFSDFVVGTDKDAKKAFTKEEELERLCVSAFPHQSTFIRRSVFHDYGLYREDKQIVSDWWLTVCALIKGNASIEYFPDSVAILETNGISQLNRDRLYAERLELLEENDYFFLLMDFYTKNNSIIKALRQNRFVFFLFRIYFFFYRKLSRAPHY